MSRNALAVRAAAQATQQLPFRERRYGQFGGMLQQSVTPIIEYENYVCRNLNHVRKINLFTVTKIWHTCHYDNCAESVLIFIIEVDVLVAFYCDRLKDHHSVTPHVLFGMAALVSKHVKIIFNKILSVPNVLWIMENIKLR